MVTIRKWPTNEARDFADLIASGDAKIIAEALKRFAESSRCHTGTPYERALDTLSDYLVQNGAVLSTQERQTLEDVKDWLRDMFTVRG